ncbi:hypothetical protein NDN08_005178 [Rhodosorus marinus]|uniref:FAD-binding PCMH-type domain-containing protein n=1 Tax=Rhodosorus marinus TaxID=101924 RepID=A0AAV8V2J9_9RHOD|nr:hypothetical protein NDN08_005178 [Rhodosorus marinus]
MLTGLLRRGSSAMTVFGKRLSGAAASAMKPVYSEVTGDDVDFFRSKLQPGAIVQGTEDLASYNKDWMNQYFGKSKLALRPKTTEEVSQLLRYCNEKRIPVVPQGGNTGLVGGSVPVKDEVIVSMSIMNKILDFDEVSGTITCEAGCVLETLDDYLADKGYRMPLDLGAKGSCQIGGNVATNAGGSRFVRYGSLRNSILGMEFVLADGTIVDTLTSLKKDNTGYDLKQLMIGSEGTLGIITKLTISTPRRLPAVNAALLGLESFEDVTKLLVEAKTSLGEVLSAFEFMDLEAVELGLKHLHGVRDPFESRYKCYVLIETVGSNPTHDGEKLEGFLEKSFEAGTLVDGVIAQDNTQMDSFWALREGLPEALLKEGTQGTLKYDVSLPMKDFYELVTDTRERLSQLPAATVGWGHIGDGNLHLNIAITEKGASELVKAQMDPFLYEWVRSRRGSISAEHGLGLMKAEKIYYTKPKSAVDIMKLIKHALDPNGILNPHKVLPRS